MEQSRKFKISILILTAVITLLPAFNRLYRIFPETELKGLAGPLHPPALNLKNIKNEYFQKNLAEYLMKKNTSWPWMLKTSNQLFYTFFNQVSAGFNGSILTTEDGSFFQPIYLRSFNRSKKLKEKDLKGISPNIKKLEGLLEKRGIKLVTLISPNMINVYPENLPSKYTNPTRLNHKNSYDFIKPELLKNNVNLVDMHEVITNTNKITGFYGEGPSFLPTASHWNQVTSCIALDRILDLSIRNKFNINKLPCNKFEMVLPPPQAELDLLEIANLLYPEYTYKPAPNISIPENFIPANTPKPKILLVGTSFFFAIHKHLEDFKISDSTKLFFYYREVKEKNLDVHRTLNKKNINWEEDILKNDLIILEANQGSIGKLGYGFVKDALNYLKKNPVKK